MARDDWRELGRSLLFGCVIPVAVAALAALAWVLLSMSHQAVRD
jgi:hypothetical protein